MTRPPLILLAGLLLPSLTSPVGAGELITWERLHLDPKFYSEGASFGDVDQDGNVDVLSGPFAWLGPKFEEKIEIYAPKAVDPKSYSDNFLNFTHDFNQDGWIDYLVIGFPGKESRWYENPKGAAEHWPVHIALPVTDNESPAFTDITGDGHPEIVCSVDGRFGYASPDPDNPTKPFVWHTLSARGATGGRFTHGLGVGDVDGDGRVDLLEKGRWHQQPKSLDGDPDWKSYRHDFGGGGGAQMFAYDFDGDGDNDILTSLNGHGYGLAWYEQHVEEGKKKLTPRLIMGQKREENAYGVVFSQLHGLAMGDIDGDGIEDVVTGKRFWAHGGSDPGGNDPAVLHWFRTARTEGGGVEFVPHQIDNDSGVGCQVTVGDVNGDSFPDVIVGNKKGTFVHLQKRETVDRDTWLRAQPRKPKKMAHLVRESEPLPPEEEAAKLFVPPGFKIELFAAEPMINKPINLAVDGKGRVWVSSTVEYPYAAEKSRWADDRGSRVKDSRDAIKILEDTDGDGAADKVADFAGGLNIPTGVLPWHRPEHQLGCIAWSIPNIWYFADTTGDGQADHREVLFGPLGYEKDTHGMCSGFRLGPDGWVYATHGFNNSSVVRAKDGSEITLRSGNVFRFQPDGSRVELWSGGQVNPFGLAFDRRGNLYSADCHSSPVYQLIQGATYPHFGNPAPAIGFGPTMIQHTHGSTGICGIVYVDRDRWGPDWNDRVIIGNPVNSRVNLDRVKFSGTSPRAIEQPDFIGSDDPWFRPVDLCFGNKGELYVADFYNRIIGHYEVPLDHPGRDRERGRIWRVTKEKDVKADIPEPEAPVTLPDPAAALADPSPFARRRAAAQLRNAPEVDALRPLLTCLASTPQADTHLRHVLRLAIRETLGLDGAFSQATVADAEILDLARDVPTEAAAGYLLKSANPLTDRALAHIVRYGSAETIAACVTHASKLAGDDAPKQGKFIGLIHTGFLQRGRFEPHPALIDWATTLAKKLLTENDGEPVWIEERPNPAAPSPWVLQPRRCADNTEATVLSSLSRSGGDAEKLTGAIYSKPFAAPAQLSFWICGHRGQPSKSAHDHNFVVLQIDGKELHRAYPPRNDACQKVEWSIPAEHQGKPAVLKVVDGDTGASYAWLGITRISGASGVSVDAFSAGHRRETLRILADVLKTTARVDLRDRLRPWMPPAPKVESSVSPEQAEATRNLIAARVAAYEDAKPKAEQGRAVFTRHCAACHRIGQTGALVGPQLDGIGARGIKRLCEDILDPNRNVDAHFRLTQLALADGTALTGYIELEEGELVLARDLAGTVRKVPKSQIKSRRPLAISLMPATFGTTIPEAEFLDLLGWLNDQ